MADSDFVRIWHCTPIFPGKVNFVDTNDVIVGYDMEQKCCENASWVISKNFSGDDPLYENDDLVPQEIQLDGYCFDPEYHEIQRNIPCEYDSWQTTDVVIFKLIDSDGELPDLFLRLSNTQNGYYNHNFVFRGNVVVEDAL